MAEFVPIDPTGKTVEQLLTEVAHAINKTHDCVHRGQAEQAERDKDASEKRHAMAQELMTLQGDVRNVGSGLEAVKDEVAEMRTRQDIDSGRITRLSKGFGAEKLEPGEKVKLRGVAGWDGWKAAATVFGSLSGVVLAYKIAEPLLEPALKAIHHAIMAAG